MLNLRMRTALVPFDLYTWIASMEENSAVYVGESVDSGRENSRGRLDAVEGTIALVCI